MNQYLDEMTKAALVLYHYSAEPYDSLKTRRAQGHLTPHQMRDGRQEAEFRQDVAPYYDHVSFFSRPLPLATIGKLYAGKGNALWNPGQALYEHAVDTRDLDGFKYTMVETPADVAEVSSFPDEKDVEAKRKYFARRAVRRRKMGDVGDTEEMLQAALGKYPGLKPLYEAATEKYTSEEDWNRYATGVPHVMLYPNSGVIPLMRPPKKRVVGGEHHA